MIETDRLILRGWRDEDGPEFVRITNTPAVMRHLGGVQEPAVLLASVPNQQRMDRDHGHCFWLAERKADGALLDFCGLKVAGLPGTPLDGAIEIGWRLREDAWGQGYASEAARASLRWAWANLPATRVIAITVPDNVSSQRVMQRIGMTRRPDLDFAHPNFAADHRLSAHITYVIERAP